MSSIVLHNSVLISTSEFLTDIWGSESDMHVLKWALNRQKWVISTDNKNPDHQPSGARRTKSAGSRGKDEIFKRKHIFHEVENHKGERCVIYLLTNLFPSTHPPSWKIFLEVAFDWSITSVKVSATLIQYAWPRVCHRYQAEAFTLCLCNLEENKVCYRPVSFGKSCDIQKKDLPQTSNRGFLPQYLYSEETQTCNRSVGFGMFC